MMGLTYSDLDDRTRQLMLEEIDRDTQSGTLYLSENLSSSGKAQYPGLLRQAAESGTDDSLAAQIKPLLNSHEKPRQLKSGKLSKPPVMRSNAHNMLAEGEFNRFYMRALCLRALEEGREVVTVYRAKQVTNARSASEAMIESTISAPRLLEDLRTSQGVDTALGLPPGPNSGLSVRLS